MVEYVHVRAYVALLLAAIIIGLVPVLVRIAGLDPSASAFWRMFLSCIFLASMWWVNPALLPDVQAGKSRKMVYWAGIYFALDLIFLHISLAHTNVATASLLNNLAPIFSGGIVIFFGAYLGARYWLGVLVSISGVYFLLGNVTLLADGQLPIGEIAGVISAIFFALYLHALQSARKIWSTGVILLKSGIAASLVLAPVALIFETTLLPNTVESWLAILALATVCQLLGQACLVYSAAHLPSMIVANGMLCQTIFATIFALLLFQETLEWAQVAGIFVTLVGVSIVMSGKNRQNAKRQSIVQQEA